MYQHQRVKPIEDMIFNAFLQADPKIKIFDAVTDMSLYVTLTDSIFYEILRSTIDDPGVRKAQRILRDIQVRLQFLLG